MPFPKISIVFCLKCKWNLRSAWYLQELLQTFGDQLGEVSLIPGPQGQFKILGQRSEGSEDIVIWDRATEGGFPDSKYLKQRVKELLFHGEVCIGKHNETKNTKNEGGSSKRELLKSKEISQNKCSDCQDDNLSL